MTESKNGQSGPEKQERFWLGSKVILLKILGIILLIMGIIILRLTIRETLWILTEAFNIEFLKDSSISGFTIGAIKGGFAGIIGFGGILLFIHAKKLKTAAFAKTLEHDDRPPVLYLRSFKDDPVMGRPTTFSISLPSVTTLEEQLALVLNEIGPFIAIGKPGERLPHLGARRYYVDVADWQAKISELMKQSRLVILRLGKTKGFWWELKTAAATVSPERLVMLVPFKRKKYDEFKAEANLILSNPLPEYSGHYNYYLGFTGLIYFDPDGTAHFTRPPSIWSMKSWRCARIVKPLMPYFKQVFRPVFRNLDIPWVPPKASFITLIVSGFGLIALAGAIGMFSYLLFTSNKTGSIDTAVIPCAENFNHPEILSALSNYSQEEVRQQARQLSSKGLHRLENAKLLNRTLIMRDLIFAADNHLCAELVKGTITPSNLQSLLEKLDPKFKAAFCEIAFEAMLAELRQVAPPETLTESEVDEALVNLMQSVPETDANRMVSLLDTLNQADDIEACWLGKKLYGTIYTMEEPYRSNLARALVME